MNNSNDKILIIAIVVSLATGLFIGKTFLSRIKTVTVEAACDPKLLDENVALRDRIEQLTGNLQESQKNCDADYIKAKHLQELDKQRKEQEELQAAKNQKRQEELQGTQSYLTKIRNGDLTLLEWRELLKERNKDAISKLLGSPDLIKKPQTTEEVGMETWKYRSKVKLEENPRVKKDLYIRFLNEIVYRVHRDNE